MTTNNISVELTSSLGSMYAPVLSVYYDGDNSNITLTSGDKITLVDGATSIEIPLVGRTTTQVVSSINRSSLPYRARVLFEVQDIGTIDLLNFENDSTIDGGKIIRAQGHIVQRQEATQIRILPPYNGTRNDPWYIVVNKGWVSRRFAGGNWQFAVPEYTKQTWSTFYGQGFIDIKNAIVERLGPRAIGVARAPIHWDRSNIILRVKGQVQPSSAIRDVDVNNGIIYLNRDYDDNEIILVDYTYAEDGYEYTGIDLNPSEFHNPGAMERHTLFYLLPYIGPDGKLRDSCVRHVTASSLRGALQMISKTNEPILVLGSAYIRAAHDYRDIQITDTRTISGGVDLDRFDEAVKENREVLSITDRGFYDGSPFAGNMALFLQLPDTIRTTFQEAEIDGIIKKFSAYGTYFFVEFE